MGKQKTIKSDVVIEGVGIHTGCDVKMTLKPAKENEGISFKRVDIDGQPLIKVEAKNVSFDSGIPRCTSIGQGEAMVHTVEHLMSVLAGLSITNLIIEINAAEIPGLDGSGQGFLDAIKSVGVQEQSEEAHVYKIMEPIGVEANGSSIYIVPANEFKVSYTLDYNHPVLKSQFFSREINNEVYEKEIAPCRTFCLESEANDLQVTGLGKGANYTNTLVVGDQGVIDNKTHFDDEFARHKVLDFIGDLYLLGQPICGHVYAIKSGHRLNISLLKKIAEQKERVEKTTQVTLEDYSQYKEIDIQGIMSILPHRYPFLLVDRVIEVEHGKSAIGIKNVTINDNFFQGHFPTRPVMPGVLMVEAMAQTAGVVTLTSEAHRGKLAFFMAVNNVKFRKVVTAGDQLMMHVEVIKDKTRTTQIRGEARVGDDIVAEADMTFSFTDSSYLD